MKTSSQRMLLLITVTAVLITTAGAQTPRTATYIGKPGANWSDAANWSPHVIPNNDATHSYNVLVGVEIPGVTLDIDVTLSSLTLNADGTSVFATDASLTSARTDVASTITDDPYAGIIGLAAKKKSVTFNLGQLANFSGTTLASGVYLIDSTSTVAGATATLQFNGANIQTLGGGVQLAGASSRLVDEQGHNALANLQHIRDSGVFEIDLRDFAIAGSLQDDGNVNVVAAGFPGIFGDQDPVWGPATLTIGGDLTLVSVTGNSDLGAITCLSSKAGADARTVVNGRLTNYDSSTNTLNGGVFDFTAANGSASTIQILGGTLLNVVHSDAFIGLFGPNTGILDATGNDALRNLASNSFFFRIADRSFTTAGSFIDDGIGILSIRGDATFAVSGDLTIQSGILHETEETGYSFNDFVIGVPLDQRYVNSATQVKGDLTLMNDANLRFDIWPSDATATVNVTGAATLDGDLEIFLMGGADGALGNGRTLLTASSISGAFTNARSGGRVLAYASDRTRLLSFKAAIAGSYKVNYSGTSLVLSDFQPYASMLNLSTRVDVQPNDSGAGIAGFIVRGGSGNAYNQSPSAPKKMLIRGIGPSLAAKGVANALQDPVLELRDSTGKLIASNDNWQSSQKADIEATGIAPSDPRESAIIAPLAPGNYTAVMRGSSNGTGTGLVELYDLDDQPPPSELANLSTRGFVGTGTNVMIGGVIIGDDNPAEMVIRALGPSLASQGVDAPLKDPTLEVRNESGEVVASNDNWLIGNSTSSAQLESEGLAPSDYRESAVEVSLKPGKYTAIVRGHNDTQGVALVEFYKLN